MRKIVLFFRELDPWMALGMAVLLLIGFTAIWSAGIAGGQNEVGKQAAALAIGLIVFFVAAIAHPRTIHRLRYIIYIAGLILLVVVLFFGHAAKGTQGWFRFGSISFQPVELAKIFLLIVLAAILPLHARTKSLRAMIGATVVSGVYVFLVMLQPDLGSSLILIALWAVMLLASGIPRRYVAGIFIVAIAVAALAWQFGLHDYQKARVLTFLDPMRDARGRGYNVAQAQIAVGSGGLFGKGFASGSQGQLRFLPESQTDFVFSLIVEEFGLAAGLTVCAALGLIVFRLYRLSCRAPDDFSQFLAIGAAALITTETLVAVGGNIGLLPVTGITLPFVSAGGSSLIAHFILLGLTQSAYRAAARGSAMRPAELVSST
jgi:rod shape determining protein RodA